MALRRLSASLPVAIVAAAALVLLPAAALARERVPFEGFEAGTIVVRTRERHLYLPLGDGTAIRYPVAVGKPGKQWFGRRVIDGKYVEPAWSPPADVKHDNPNLPDVIPGGSPRNPMGARALTIAPGQYAVHGTNMPNSIGRFASYGCVRMYNDDIVDLFGRVRVGAAIVVVP